jgi:hypothetical protein
MTTKKAKKTFDCVAMKREIQRQISAEIAGMTHAEELEYYRREAGKGPFGWLWRAAGENPNVVATKSASRQSPPPRAHGTRPRKRPR